MRGDASFEEFCVKGSGEMGVVVAEGRRPTQVKHISSGGKPCAHSLPCVCQGATGHLSCL